MDDQPLAVDVPGLDVKRFVEAQAALVDDGAVGAVAAVAEGAQQAADLVTGQDMRQRFLELELDLLPDVPIAGEVVAVEGAQGADGLVEGGAGELAVGLEVDEEVEDLARFEIGQRNVWVVVGKLGSPAEVGFDGAAAQAFELDEAEVVLIPLCGGDVAAR